jgi:hypothetical protein
MSIVTSYKSQLSTVETLADTPSAATNYKKVTHAAYDTEDTLNATSTPPGTKCAFWQETMTDGAATIDLTALTGTNGATIAMTGLKVQVFRATALGTNGNTVTVAAGTDAYNLAGDGWTVDLEPGQEFVFYGNDATPDVASGSADEIDISGTGTDKINFSVICG